MKPQSLYQQQDEAGFWEWAFGKTSKIEGAIANRERSLKWIQDEAAAIEEGGTPKEGAYRVMQDEDALAKATALTTAQNIVNLAMAAAGAGKTGVSAPEAAEAQLVSNVGPRLKMKQLDLHGVQRPSGLWCSEPAPAVRRFCGKRRTDGLGGDEVSPGGLRGRGLRAFSKIVEWRSDPIRTA